MVSQSVKSSAPASVEVVGERACCTVVWCQTPAVDQAAGQCQPDIGGARHCGQRPAAVSGHDDAPDFVVVVSAVVSPLVVFNCLSVSRDVSV